MKNHVVIKKVETLSDDWYILKKTTFDYQRKDGHWQTMSRETYDRGNGAVILLYNQAMKRVVLTRQFRFPAYVNNHPDGMLVEACAGLLEEDNAEACIRKETEEETGYRVHQVRQVLDLFMSPGSVTERLIFFVAEYTNDHHVAAGGGLESDGEEIEVLEIPFEQALAMIETGEIVDGKTVILLQYAKLHNLMTV